MIESEKVELMNENEVNEIEMDWCVDGGLRFFLFIYV